MARLGLYQPFIEDRNVRRLYRLKIHYLNRGGRKVPMTILVNRVLDDFFEAQEREDAPSNGLDRSPFEFIRRRVGVCLPAVFLTALMYRYEGEKFSSAPSLRTPYSAVGRASTSEVRPVAEGQGRYGSQ